jgi:hypothetical protein
MAINSFDAERDQLLRDNKRLRDIIPHALESLMIGGKGGSPGQPYDDPEKGKGPFVPPPGKGLTIAHGEGRGPQPKYHDEYNRELPIPPWMQMFPDGKVREIPWMKEEYLKEHPELASGPDYIGDKLKYGQLDRILNPLGNFQRPTLDQLRIHARNYPKV